MAYVNSKYKAAGFPHVANEVLKMRISEMLENVEIFTYNCRQAKWSRGNVKTSWYRIEMALTIYNKAILVFHEEGVKLHSSMSLLMNDRNCEYIAMLTTIHSVT